jgi:hypothetical protein
MVHHRQCLALRLEPGNDLLGVHPQFDDFESDAPAHRRGLLGHVDDAAATFAQFLEQLVGADPLKRRFRIIGFRLDCGSAGSGIGRFQCRGQQAARA